MESLADLISRDMAPEPGRVNSPTAHPIDAPIPTAGTETEPHAFEIAVFNFLLAHKEPLGISAVWRCRNVRVDGLVDLADGRRIALEIKYRMNWEKACQACAQFGWYRTRVEANEKPLSSGLVVFETFSGDWARRKTRWLLENGWNFFYMDHQKVEGLRVDLVRFRDGMLESFPNALAAARARAPGPELGPDSPGFLAFEVMYGPGTIDEKADAIRELAKQYPDSGKQVLGYLEGLAMQKEARGEVEHP